jgi:hypothetical protein
VIEIPMGKQDRHRVEPVLAKQLIQGLFRTLPRIDHHARATGLGSEHETVRLEGT